MRLLSLHAVPARAGADRGALPLEFALGVAVLVLPIALLVSVFPDWAERQSMARLAVREAARVGALADSAPQGEGDAEALARQIAANHGLDQTDLRGLEVTVPTDGDGRPLRGGEVIARLEVRIPLTAVPLIGDIGGFWWGVSHHETIDRYRSLPAPSGSGGSP